MISYVWNAVKNRFKRQSRRAATPKVVMTTQCLDRISDELNDGVRNNVEDIVYFIGLTTGSIALVLYGIRPKASRTAHSVDVTPDEIGKIVRLAALSELQVVGQLHTHPKGSGHSPGDFSGMRIRYPGYFSIVAPQYGSKLPSLSGLDIVMATNDGFTKVKDQVKLIDGTKL